jgi:hypothetical protein
VPRRRTSGSPRATRAMIDVLYAVASSRDVVGSWEVSGQLDGLGVRVHSRDAFEVEADAIEAAERMVKALVPGGYEAVSTTTSGRSEGRAGVRWRGVAELVIRASE